MFSDVGKALDQDTIEYAWLIEVQMGKLSGKLTAPQLYTIMASLETLVLLLADSENEFHSPADDAILSQPQTTQNIVNTAQNLPQHVQQAIQQLLQPKSNVTGAPKANHQPTGILHKNIQSIEKSSKNIGERKKSEEVNNRKTVTGDKRSCGVEEETKEVDSHKLKYKLLRVAVDAIDFWLVEGGAALQLWVSTY